MGEMTINQDFANRLVHLLAYQHLQIVHLRGKLAAAQFPNGPLASLEEALEEMRSEAREVWMDKGAREESLVSISLQLGMSLTPDDLKTNPDQMWRVFGEQSDRGFRDQLGE
jgi:hypothetical protein